MEEKNEIQKQATKELLSLEEEINSKLEAFRSKYKNEAHYTMELWSESPVVQKHTLKLHLAYRIRMGSTI